MRLGAVPGEPPVEPTWLVAVGQYVVDGTNWAGTMETVAQVKIGLALVLLLTAVGGIWLPQLLSRRIRKSEKMTLRANMFSAGAILAAALTHLLPDSLAAAPEISHALCIAAGSSFIAMVVTDVVAQQISRRSMPELASPHALINASPRPEASFLPGPTPFSSSRHFSGGSASDGGFSFHPNCTTTTCNERTDLEASLLAAGMNGHDRRAGLADAAGASTGGISASAAAGPALAAARAPPTDGGLEEAVDLQVALSPQGTTSTKLWAVATWSLAFSVHSFVEGLAMGAQQSNQQVLNVFVAIVSHKALAAFVVGMMLTCRALKSTVFWLVAGPFALATPVGIAVGMGLAADDHMAAIFTALGTGTFLYISAAEMIPGALANSDDMICKLSLLCLGFALMTGASYLD